MSRPSAACSQTMLIHTGRVGESLSRVSRRVLLRLVLVQHQQKNKLTNTPEHQTRVASSIANWCRRKGVKKRQGKYRKSKTADTAHESITPGDGGRQWEPFYSMKRVIKLSMIKGSSRKRLPCLFPTHVSHTLVASIAEGYLLETFAHADLIIDGRNPENPSPHAKAAFACGDAAFASRQLRLQSHRGSLDYRGMCSHIPLAIPVEYMQKQETGA